MQLIRRFRIPALCCALCVLFCALLSRPFTNMGVLDDGPYILMAQHLEKTGHVVYNGWAAPMLGWQLYLGAAFIKLFGFSFTAARMSTLLVSMLLAFLLERTLVRGGINERNATLGTLALVLSPLYLILSVTYMSDLFGIFAIVVCLYCCLRALQAAQSLGDRPAGLSDDGSANPGGERAVILWLCSASVSNAILGTARQFAWLGILVMIPCTLLLLHGLLPWRSRRRVLSVGATACLAGALFVFACMQWLKRQPYTVQQPVLRSTSIPFAYDLVRLIDVALDVSLLLLPITLLFLPQILEICANPKTRWAGSLALAILCSGYILVCPHPRSLAYRLTGRHPAHPHGLLLLLPANLDWGYWFTSYGVWSPILNSTPPASFGRGLQMLLTWASAGGLIAIAVSLLFGSLRGQARSSALTRPNVTSPSPALSVSLSSRQLLVVVGPAMAAYSLFLVAVMQMVLDRYLLLLAPLVLLLLIRLYQDKIRPHLPSAAWVLLALLAMFATAVTHNSFALYRAIGQLAAEMRAAGIPDTAVDYGWPQNLDVELQHSNHINDPRILTPADSHVSVPAPLCPMTFYFDVPHIRPLYGVSFRSDLCYGQAPFAPVRYPRWLATSLGTLYVVRYTPVAN